MGAEDREDRNARPAPAKAAARVPAPLTGAKQLPPKRTRKRASVPVAPPAVPIQEDTIPALALPDGFDDGEPTAPSVPPAALDAFAPPVVDDDTQPNIALEDEMAGEVTTAGPDGAPSAVAADGAIGRPSADDVPVGLPSAFHDEDVVVVPGMRPIARSPLVLGFVGLALVFGLVVTWIALSDPTEPVAPRPMDPPTSEGQPVPEVVAAPAPPEPEPVAEPEAPTLAEPEAPALAEPEPVPEAEPEVAEPEPTVAEPEPEPEPVVAAVEPPPPAPPVQRASRRAAPVSAPTARTTSAMATSASTMTTARPRDAARRRPPRRRTPATFVSESPY